MNKKSVIWNTIGSLIYSVATILLATVVKRLAGTAAGDDFTFAFTVGQTLLTIGYFEVRLFQVTDAREVYGFQDYFTFRLLTCSLMMAACLVYLAVTGRRGQMALLILVLSLFKMMDALGDVFEGDYQKHERLDLAGISLTVRTLAAVLVFAVVLKMTDNVTAASALMTLAALAVVCIVNPRMRRCYGQDRRIRLRTTALWKLFLECVSLALGAFLCSCILNGVKFAVDAYAPDYNYIFSALFMPTSVINLLGVLMFKPVLTTLTAYYEQHRYDAFLKLLLKLMAAVAGMTLICMAGAWLLGVPVLSAIYAVDLAPYKAELLILLAGGGFNAAGVLAYYSLVVMRRQKNILACYGVTFVLTCLLPFVMVRWFQIRGAAIAFVLVMLIQLLVFASLLLWSCGKESKAYENC
jgi:O-antigen/teichoic acid export membrane protein